ncbi:GAF domain protein [Cyclobacterium qasimii M12-11B]|nr:GAF domain protein [Cyclobacterium qasimii M12-11B]
MGSPPEKELDELAKIASLICNVPISLITIIDKDRQWLMVNSGLGISETKRKDSFCQHALHKPKEVLVVRDSTKDLRFKNNPFVIGEPKIRFYAGAPLETPNGNVLGTLCVLDNRPRSISSNHKKALQILAKKAMDYLNTRKLLLEQNSKIETNISELKKLTDNVPGGIFQLKMDPNGELNFEFLSSGMKALHPTINFEEWAKSPELGFSLIHPDDIGPFQKSLSDSLLSLTPFCIEYRVKVKNEYNWHYISAKPQKMPDGSVLLYGSFQNINNRIEFGNALEQISFDISHVLRKPVTSLLGLTQLLEDGKAINKSELMEYVGYIKSVSIELDQFTRDLDKIYREKRKKFNSKKN